MEQRSIYAQIADRTDGTVYIGDNEIESGVVSLKNMQDGTQTTVKADEIEKYLA